MKGSVVMMGIQFRFSMRMVLAAFVLGGLALSGTAFADAKPEEIIRDALSVIEDMSAQDDVQSMAETLKGAHAIAIIPSMVKAGFIIGGEYGEGLILRREKGKWYGPSFYNLGGGSFGLQIGAQSVALALVVINEKGVEAFTSSKTKLGGDIGIAAGPVGRRAEAATDAQAKASIYSYSMSKGLFAGLSLEGSVISVSVKRNEQYWKKSIKGRDALNIPASDKRIKPLLSALDALIKKAK